MGVHRLLEDLVAALLDIPVFRVCAHNWHVGSLRLYLHPAVAGGGQLVEVWLARPYCHLVLCLRAVVHSAAEGLLNGLTGAWYEVLGVFRAAVATVASVEVAATNLLLAQAVSEGAWSIWLSGSSLIVGDAVVYVLGGGHPPITGNSNLP